MHVCHAGLLAIDHISGLFNVMADVASQKHSTDPHTFLSNFSTTSPTSEHLLDIVPIQRQAHIQALFRSMSKSLGNGVVASTKRERLRFWSAWQTWLAFNFPTVHPNLHQVSRSDQIELLAAFAHHVRSGGVSRRTHQVRTQTVQVAL